MKLKTETKTYTQKDGSIWSWQVTDETYKALEEYWGLVSQRPPNLIKENK